MNPSFTYHVDGEKISLPTANIETKEDIESLASLCAGAISLDTDNTELYANVVKSLNRDASRTVTALVLRGLTSERNARGAAAKREAAPGAKGEVAEDKPTL